MGFVGSLFRAGAKAVKGIKFNPTRIIKGLKNTAGNIGKGVKNVGKGINKRINELIFKPKIGKETIIKKGTTASKKVGNMKAKPVAGKFDESLINIKPIKDITRQPLVKQGLKKKQRLELAKAAIKSGKPIKKLF